jgi:hypothetical protein
VRNRSYSTGSVGRSNTSRYQVQRWAPYPRRPAPPPPVIVAAPPSPQLVGIPHPQHINSFQPHIENMGNVPFAADANTVWYTSPPTAHQPPWPSSRNGSRRAGTTESRAGTDG